MRAPGPQPVVLCSLLVLAVLGACGAPPSERPGWNVIVVLVDTLRADHLSLYGYGRDTSPRLEALAERGVVFEQARSQAGCTFPSVNSLFTSRYPQLFQQTTKEYGWAIPEYVPTFAEMLKANGYRTAAVSSSPIVRVNPSKRNPDGGYGAGFDQFDDSCEWKSADCINEAAFGILDGLESEPFLLYLHYFEPHGPYNPPARHERRFAAQTYDKPWVADGTLYPLLGMLYDDGPEVEFTDGDLAQTIGLYDDEIAYFDDQFALLVERLESDGLLDRTLVAFVADHGEELYDRGYMGHCYDFTWDSSVRTPFVLWIPGLEKGWRTDALAQNLDLVPTLLDYLGIEALEYDLHGKSLRPLLEDGNPVHRYVFGIQRYARWVTDGRYKLSYNIWTEETVLYDLSEDPTEQTDVAEQRPEVVADLKGTLMRWIEAAEGDASTRIEQAGAATERLKALGYL